MKWLLLVPIKIYWYVIPAHNRNTCIYKKSCSNFVFETTVKTGFITGFKAFVYRYKNCRSNYQVIQANGSFVIITANHERIENDDIRENLIK